MNDCRPQCALQSLQPALPNDCGRKTPQTLKQKLSGHWKFSCVHELTFGFSAGCHGNVTHLGSRSTFEVKKRCWVLNQY